MKEMKTILVTTDFSDISKEAFEHARMLGEKFGARIILLHALEDHIHPLATGYPGLQLQEIMDAHREKSEAELERIAISDVFGGLEVRALVRDGLPHSVIVETAQDENADLIVIATHGRGFFAHAFLGSTTERVLRRAPCPVLAVRHGGEGT